jgi:prepilin-type N-terminal cleavage/methylation domain-containing protein
MRTRRFPSRSGFTLLELLAVMTIIGVLAGLIIGASKYAYQKSRRSSAAARIAALETALEDFKADNGYYPTQAAVPSGSTTILYQALNGVTTGKKYFTTFTARSLIRSAMSISTSVPALTMRRHLIFRATERTANLTRPMTFQTGSRVIN